jgi:hypothetical protein
MRRSVTLATALILSLSSVSALAQGGGGGGGGSSSGGASAGGSVGRRVSRWRSERPNQRGYQPGWVA